MCIIVVCKHYYLEVILKQLRPQSGISLWSVNILTWMLSTKSLDPSHAHHWGLYNLLLGGYLETSLTPVFHTILVHKHYYLEAVCKQFRPKPGPSLWSVNITTWMLSANSLDPNKADHCGL